MRFLFKTAYEQDIRLFRDGTPAVWYALLTVIVLAIPSLLSRYYIRRDHVGVHLWHLRCLANGAGRLHRPHFAGPRRLFRHRSICARLPAEAWCAVGCLGRAVLITTACGVIVGLPALRMTGIYLAIATLAFAVIIQEVFTRWEFVTGGFAGLAVDSQ